jgi:hypothetical protein
MDEASNHLFNIPELEETQSLHDHSHDSSDLASARQIHITQLVEIRNQHQISATTSAEIAIPTASTCLSCERTHHSSDGLPCTLRALVLQKVS